MKKEADIVLVGDKGVGKSALATSILTGGFVDIEPGSEVVDTVVLPPDHTPDHILTRIHDTPSDFNFWDENVIKRVKQADCVCILYDASIPRTFQRASTIWLSKIDKISQAPILFVCNKIDRIDESLPFEEHMQKAMVKYPQVETGIECSVKNLFNVSEVIFYALRAVLYPTKQIYDSNLACLKPKCIKVLRRIFRFGDTDLDGVWNDTELCDFQERVFGEPLKEYEMSDLKKLILQHCPGGVVKLGNDETGISQEGFTFLQTLFIQKGNLEVVWTILRKFGYEDDLSGPEFIKNIPELPDTSTVELSPHGIDFLTHIFAVCDLDGDEALNSAEWDLFLSTCDHIPWDLSTLQTCVETNEMGNLSMSGCLSFWQLWLSTEPAVARQNLYYLGCEKYDDAVKEVRNGCAVKKRDQRSKTVHHVYLFGLPDSGKTSLMRTLATPNDEVTVYKDDLSEVVCSRNDDGKFLIHRNFDDTTVMSDQDVMRKCDVLGVVFDGAKKHSFSNVMDVLDNVILHKNNDFLVPLNLPVVCISSKSDLPAESQLCEIEDDGVGNDEIGENTTFITPEAFLDARGLPNPIMVSSKSKEMNDLPQLLSGVAVAPNVSIPHTKIHPQSHVSWLKVAGGIVGLVGIGVGGYLLYKKLKRS